MVAATQIRRLVERLVVPVEPGARPRAALYRKNRARLLREQPGCWVARPGCSGAVECHHIVPWSMRGRLDPVRLGRVLGAMDPYGYSAEAPAAVYDINDIRNLILLCEAHHVRPGLGVHALSLPTWLALCARADGQPITVEEQEAAGAG